MSINDTLKICLVITLISLSFFILSSGSYLVHKIFTTDKIEVQVNGTYLIVETENDN